MVQQRSRGFPAATILLIALTLVTAAIHFTLAFPDTVFILNALGYLALLGALLLPIGPLADHRRLVRFAFAGYAAVTVLLWLAIGERTVVGYVATLDEVLLIALLLLNRDIRADTP